MIKQILTGFCALILTFSLCACNTASNTTSSSNTTPYPAWEIAANEETFADLLSDKLFTYSGYMTAFSEDTEEFYMEVQNGKKLTDNTSYSILREKILGWCYGVDTYPKESVFESMNEVFQYYSELSSITHSFIDTMDTVSNITDMETSITSFTIEATNKLSQITQAAQPIYLIGKWLVNDQYIWEYKEDGTFISPSGTIEHWRLKDATEEEDPSIWKLQYQNTQNSQIYYEVVNDMDLTKLTVTPMQDGTLQVIKEVAYSGTYTTFIYSPLNNASTEKEVIPSTDNKTPSSTEKYWCMGKNDTCQNKTNRPDDFFCDECDPNKDNIEG